MCLTPTYGNLDLGAIDPNKFIGNLTYLPTLTTGSLSGYFTVSMTSSTAGSVFLTAAGSNVPVIFDSGALHDHSHVLVDAVTYFSIIFFAPGFAGTTLILPTAAWLASFRAAVAGSYQSSVVLAARFWQPMNAAQLSTWPTLSFTFLTASGGSYIVSLPPSMYLRSGPNGYVLGISTTASSLFLMGDVFLQAIYVLHDPSGNRLGVAPVGNCACMLGGGNSSASGSSTAGTCRLDPQAFDPAPPSTASASARRASVKTVAALTALLAISAAFLGW